MMLKQGLQSIQSLIVVLQELDKNDLLDTIEFALDEDEVCSQLAVKIDEIIDEDVGYGKGALPLHQRCYAVKQGVNNLLDVARKTMSELTEDVMEYFNSIKMKCPEEVTLKFDQRKGYLMLVRMQDNTLSSTLEFDFITLKKTATQWIITTLDLLKLNQRLAEATKEIFLISEEYSSFDLSKTHFNKIS